MLREGTTEGSVTETDTTPISPLESYFVGLTRAEERLGTTQDIADIVLFVAEEKSRWVTGQYISASGGITGG
jgi:NAD(P)-dependent dehydrogenase (short-subunit alcohol dehydrogenase family)